MLVPLTHLKRCFSEFSFPVAPGKSPQLPLSCSKYLCFSWDLCLGSQVCQASHVQTVPKDLAPSTLRQGVSSHTGMCTTRVHLQLGSSCHRRNKCISAGEPGTRQKLKRHQTHMANDEPQYALVISFLSLSGPSRKGGEKLFFFFCCFRKKKSIVRHKGEPFKRKL